MKKLPAESFDCVFVDPPYFLQLPPKKLLRWTGSVVNGVNDQWDVFKDFDDYDNFTKNYLTEIKRLMKPNATIWVIGTYHNIHRIGKIMLDCGLAVFKKIGKNHYILKGRSKSPAMAKKYLKKLYSVEKK